jgi:hypothetical protein
MGAFDVVTGPLRWALGASEDVEKEVIRHSPVVETRALERELHDAIQAMHRACDSLERHVTVVEGLTDSLPALTESVTRLTDQLGALLTVTAPVTAVEKELSRMERIFGRRRGAEQRIPPEEPTQLPTS